GSTAGADEHRPVLKAACTLGRDLERESCGDRGAVERTADERGDARIAEQLAGERQIVVAPGAKRESRRRRGGHDSRSARADSSRTTSPSARGLSPSRA